MKAKRIRITHIHPTDGFYAEDKKYIGTEGMFELSNQTRPGYYSGNFIEDNGESTYFFGIRYINI